MAKLTIQIILGSTRQNRFGEKPALWIYKEAKKRKELEVELLDLRDYPLPFFDEPVSPATSQGKYTNKDAADWAEKIGVGDGYIWVSPEYNHGYSAVLKNALDYVYKQWHRKPVAFISYGAMGGTRAVEQLRQVAIEFQMAPIRDAVHIAAFWRLLDKKGNLKTASLKEDADNMLDQLVWWATALKKARERK